MQKDFLSIRDLSVYEFSQMLDKATEVKKNPAKYRKALKDKILAMIFQKPSLRTRMTFEAGMIRLGGEAIYLAPSDIQMGSREGAYDIGKNLERWVDGIMIRTFGHQIAVDLAASCKIPVINALTDLSHPCQAMADFLTLREHKGALSGLKLTYVGDGNNVCHSLMLAAARGGTEMAVATPPGYEPGRRRLHRRLGLHGPGSGERGPGPHLRALPGQRPAHGPGQEGRPVHALPP